MVNKMIDRCRICYYQYLLGVIINFRVVGLCWQGIGDSVCFVVEYYLVGFIFFFVLSGQWNLLNVIFVSNVYCVNLNYWVISF